MSCHPLSFYYKHEWNKGLVSNSSRVKSHLTDTQPIQRPPLSSLFKAPGGSLYWICYHQKTGVKINFWQIPKQAGVTSDAFVFSEVTASFSLKSISVTLNMTLHKAGLVLCDRFRGYQSVLCAVFFYHYSNMDKPVCDCVSSNMVNVPLCIIMQQLQFAMQLMRIMKKAAVHKRSKVRHGQETLWWRWEEINVQQVFKTGLIWPWYLLARYFFLLTVNISQTLSRCELCHFVYFTATKPSETCTLNCTMSERGHVEQQRRIKAALQNKYGPMFSLLWHFLHYSSFIMMWVRDFKTSAALWSQH